MPVSLPPDVLACVIEQVTDVRALKILCEVSKTFYNLAAPRMYGVHGLTLRAWDEDCLGDIEVEEVLNAAKRPQRLLERVAKLRVTAPLSWKLWNRCIHHTAREACSGPDFQQLCERLLHVAGELQVGKLRDFTWNMGVCVPKQLLGPGGYLTVYQNSVENLCLVTDGSCVDGHENSALALGDLHCLKNISWTGLRTKPEFAALGAAVRGNAKHLRGLALDFIDWGCVTDRWAGVGDPEDDLSRLVFQVGPTSAALQYPVLATLSLSGLDVTSYAWHLARATKSPSLRSITLRSCLGWESFLHCLIEPGSQLTINTLEVYEPLHAFTPSDDPDQVLHAFLGSVNGLQNLYLSLPGPCDTKGCWRTTAARHSTTLRHFVYHVRESDHFGFVMDMKDMSLLSDSFGAELSDDDDFDETNLGHGAWFAVQSTNPLGDLRVECIGLACHPSRLREVLGPFTQKDCLQILHVRQSGTDIRNLSSWAFGKKKLVLRDQFRDFADWVFGADGIASLELLAYGDFSCQGRFAEDCFMLRRRGVIDGNVCPYSFYFPESGPDPEMEGMLSRHPGFLEACPTGTLL